MQLFYLIVLLGSVWIATSVPYCLVTTPNGSYCCLNVHYVCQGGIDITDETCPWGCANGGCLSGPCSSTGNTTICAPAPPSNPDNLTTIIILVSAISVIFLSVAIGIIIVYRKKQAETMIATRAQQNHHEHRPVGPGGCSIL